jgi:hypothetical protein
LCSGVCPCAFVVSFFLVNTYLLYPKKKTIPKDLYP